MNKNLIRIILAIANSIFTLVVIVLVMKVLFRNISQTDAAISFFNYALIFGVVYVYFIDRKVKKFLNKHK